MGQPFSRQRRWINLDSSTPEEQKNFFSNRVNLKCEPVSSKNVRKADHLMVYRYGYTHHLICTNVQGDRISVMEYGVRNCFDLSGKEALKLLVDLEKLGEVHQKSFTFEELQTMENFKMSTINGFVFLCVFFVFTRAQEQQKMSFETPKMNEEEQHSPHTPSSFEIQCDSCTVIAYKMTKALAAAEAKRPSLKGKPLRESEYLDIIEDVCDSKSYEDYGIKTVNGVNRLSGEGLEAKDFPGMMQGGGKWPGRLSSKCSNIVGDVGEDALYEKFREDGDLQEYMCKEYTKDCVKEKKSKKGKKNKKSKKSKEAEKEEL